MNAAGRLLGALARTLSGEQQQQPQQPQQQIATEPAPPVSKPAQPQQLQDDEYDDVSLLEELPALEPPWTFTKLDETECRLDVPDSAAFVPDTEEEDGLPQFELVLHHPERSASTSVANRSASVGVPADRAQFQVDALRQFKALCDRLLPGLRTQSHLYTLIHLCDRTHTVTLSEFGEVIGGATFRIIQGTEAAARRCCCSRSFCSPSSSASAFAAAAARIINYLKSLAIAIAAVASPRA